MARRGAADEVDRTVHRALAEDVVPVGGAQERGGRDVVIGPVPARDMFVP